ncbi:MAG: Hsp20/alpha crystallin family protein [Alicyclobacillus sp.]|nr:Hsp20/alpha crystallin family protein [Alicyclobacillus sp.]
MNNNFDPMAYLQQMNDQFRHLFGDDFVRNLMNSMQMPMWGAGGAMSPGARNGGQGSPGPSGASRAQSSNMGATASGPDWMNWMSQWHPYTGAGGGSQTQEHGQFPRADVYETRHEVVVVMEIPGLERSGDVRLTVSSEQLTVKGDLKRRYHRQEDVPLALSERFFGPFERAIALPARVRKQHAKAVYNAGLLEVRLLKEVKGTDGEGSPIDVDFA